MLWDIWINVAKSSAPSTSGCDVIYEHLPEVKSKFFIQLNGGEGVGGGGGGGGGGQQQQQQQQQRLFCHAQLTVDSISTIFTGNSKRSEKMWNKIEV